jgi:hypothetical protein
MIKFVKIASEIRLNALLCSSAAILLTACGGNVDGNPESAAAPQELRTAAAVVSSETTPATAVVTDAVVVESSGVRSQESPQAAPGNAQFAIQGFDAQGDAAAAAATTAEPVNASSTTTALSGSGLSLGQDSMAIVVVPPTTYKVYVSPSGNDANGGTTATTAVKTLARAAKLATRAGTTVFVAPGTYAGGIKTTASGSSSARIYWLSTTKYGARIVPPASSVNNSAWDNRGNYVSIIGFDVDGTVSQSGTKWLHGIYTGGSYDQIIENRVHHIAKSVPCNGAGGSAIGVDSYYRGIKGDVIGNLVYDIGPVGCKYIQGIYVSTSGSIKNNVVYRVSEAAIHLWHDATNVIITNNTVTASNTGIIVGSGDTYFLTGANDYSAVYNNIVYDNKYGISEQGKTGTHNTYRNNLVYKNTYNWTLKNGLTHTGTVSSEPYFTSYSRTGTSNFKPSLSSPAIGRGTATNAHPTDFAGRPRNATTGYDIGAYQH